MKTSLFLTIVSMSLFVVIGASLHAQEASLTAGHYKLPVTNHSVVYISTTLHSKSPQSACGTGLLLPSNRLLTAWHLVERNCSAATCDGVSLFWADSLGTRATNHINCDKLSVGQLFAGLDLVILQGVSCHLDAISPIPISPSISPNDQLTQVGFPGCSHLELSRGTILGADSIYIDTTLRGAPGSSGSPIFDSQNQLAAVSVQASSALEAIYARFTGSSFRVRGIHNRVLSKLIESSDSVRSIEVQAAVLNAHYAETILPAAGLTRLMESLRFLGRIKPLAKQMAATKHAGMQMMAAVLSGNDFFVPDSLYDEDGKTVDYSEMLRLALSYHMERAGLSESSIQAISQLSATEAQKADGLRALVERFHASGFWGVSRITQILGAVLLVIALAWIFSLIWVWRRTHGSAVKRGLNVIAAAIFLWPLSLLFVARGKKRTIV